MPITTQHRTASLDEIVAEMDRRGEVIEKLEAQLALAQSQPPVAWRIRQKDEEFEEWDLTAHRPEACIARPQFYEVQPLYASPVSDGEARRKALEEAADLAHARAKAYAADQATAEGPARSMNLVVITALDVLGYDLRALAAIPTAGDAK